MSTTSAGPSTDQSSYSGGAAGLTVFAALLMIIGGTMQALQGLVALFNDTFYAIGEEYLFELDVTSWGWIHLILGVVVALAGVALFQGATWARTVAVVLASMGIVANFLWMPYYPLWSITLIVFNALVIWAVTVHGRDILAQ
jgi:hypothetical protein